MFKKAKRFVRWVHEGVHLGKLWGMTLLTSALLVVLGLRFGGLPMNGVQDALLSIILLIFFALLTLALWATLARFDRWQKESPRFRNWLVGLTFFGIFAGLLFSAIVYPAETFKFFTNEWERMWADTFYRWLFTVAGWTFASMMALGFLAAIVAPVIRLLRKRL